ncbi:MAG: coenzyme F420-0:L-glutamate ligase, partial [Acidobacteria bacterium]|nr:coenzyme F420-0:L-glutamate ligase [Acidobacteriota bacterium]
MSSSIRLTAIRGIPEVRPGDDIGVMISRAAGGMKFKLTDGDIVVVAQKIISKAEGRLVNLESIAPSEFAHEIAIHIAKKGKSHDYLFLNARGGKITRRAVWDIVSK